jgi:hypothetical protein
MLFRIPKAAGREKARNVCKTEECDRFEEWLIFPRSRTKVASLPRIGPSIPDDKANGKITKKEAINEKNQ